jgi:molecular chaperone GrpE (heat shock protein)
MENAEVAAIIAELRALEDSLYERGLAAGSDEERERIRLEMNQVNARTLRLQAKLFARATRDLADDVAAISDGTARAKEAIRDIEDLNAALGGIANILGIVDTVLGFL